MIARLDARAGSILRNGDERYFLLEHQGALHAVPDACSHRGGPLSKGKVDACRGVVICPMHHLPTRIATLLVHALPMVRVDDEARVVVM